MADVVTPSRARSIPVPLGAARPAAVVLTAVLTGALVVTWLSEASVGRSRELWIEYHQAVTPAYTRALPPIGGLALIAALTALAPSWTSPRDRRLVLAAISCLLAGLAVTVVVHFPIDAEIGRGTRPRPPPSGNSSGAGGSPPMRSALLSPSPPACSSRPPLPDARESPRGRWGIWGRLTGVETSSSATGWPGTASVAHIVGRAWANVQR